MGVSIQVYRSRIGSFQASSTSYCRTRRSAASTASPSQCPGWAWSTFLILVLTSFQLLHQQSLPSPNYKEYIPKYSASRSTLPTWAWSSPSSSSTSSWSGLYSSPCMLQVVNNVAVKPFLSSKDWNFLARMINGNRSQRGHGIKLLHWNKGPSFLANKHHEIETIVGNHRPHVFGLSEANLKREHDQSLVQHQD